MRILVSGSTGFLGTSLIGTLEKEGHTVARLVRPETERNKASSTKDQVVRWDPISTELDSADAEDADVLVHLAGASIADGRWNDARKKILRSSRVDTTRQLMEALSKLQRPPRIIVASSAIGYFGDRGDEILTESSASGSDFLAALCRDWEIETTRGTQFGARVVNLRFGIVLSPHGGALPRIVFPFKFGAGGRIGSGNQWMSWLTLAEAIAIIQFAIANSQMTGPVNAVTPNPVHNSEFTRALARTLRRPAIFPAPRFALRLALGEMADALLLSSQRVVPSKLERGGYKFAQPELANALTEIFQK